MDPKKRGFGFSAGLCLLLALMLLQLPIQWVAAVMAAAAVHEICHAIAVVLCGGSIRSVSLGARGARMDVAIPSPVKELLCALAGPMGSLLLLLVGNWFPRLAICGAFHGIYNLLPVYPLDGGRALRCAAALLPGWGEKMVLWGERLSLWLLTALALYAFLWLKIGILPGLLVVWLWWKRKIESCNEKELGV